jgi:hypothetical protein
MPSIIRLEDGREFSVDSGGSVEIDVPANGGDRITVFDASENKEYRIPVAAIARISIPDQFVILALLAERPARTASDKCRLRCPRLGIPGIVGEPRRGTLIRPL